MNTKAENKRKWRNVLLATIGILFLSLVGVVLLMALTEGAWLLSCWVGILAFSALPLLLANYLSGNNYPEYKQFFEGAPWAIIGGATGFGGMFIMTRLSPYYKNDPYMLYCFGPLLGLMCFAIAAGLQENFLLLVLMFAAPYFSGYLQPYIGESAATILYWTIILGSLGIMFYKRIKREKSYALPTIVWNFARCPQCNNLWTLGQFVTEISPRCPTCDWSWIDAGVDPKNIPSFLYPET